MDSRLRIRLSSRRLPAQQAYLISGVMQSAGCYAYSETCNRLVVVRVPLYGLYEIDMVSRQGEGKKAGPLRRPYFQDHLGYDEYELGMTTCPNELAQTFYRLTYGIPFSLYKMTAVPAVLHKAPVKQRLRQCLHASHILSTC